MPLPVKIKIFRELYPNGTIANKLPEKNKTGDGIIATCLLYSDSAKIPESLIAKAQVEKWRVLSENNG